jgi:hypothetical protein
LFHDNFEGSSACWSGSSYTNCLATHWVNTFAGVDGVYNYATSPAPLQGSYSLELIGNAYHADATWTATNPAYLGAMVYVSTFETTNNDFMQLTDSSYNILCGVFLPTGQTSFGLTTTGGTIEYTVTGLTANTYYIILKGTAGTGSNAVCTMSYSTTGNAGSWTTITSTNGTWTATPAGLRLTGMNPSLIYDDIRVSSTTFNFH